MNYTTRIVYNLDFGAHAIRLQFAIGLDLVVSTWKMPQPAKRFNNSQSITHFFGQHSSNVSVQSSTLTVVPALVHRADDADAIMPLPE